MTHMIDIRIRSLTNVLCHRLIRAFTFKLQPAATWNVAAMKG